MGRILPRLSLCFISHTKWKSGKSWRRGFTIVIEARGEVENPKVIQNDAYIRLLDKLASGDKVEIDLVENTIKKNGENCIRLVDRTSSFSGMVLGVGNNTISFGADNGDRNMNVVVYYNLRYLGA